jgi:hypothetical protein
MSDPPTTTMPSPPTEPRKRRWLLPTLVGVGTFVLGLLVGVVAGGGDADQPTAGPAEPTATVTVTATAAPAEPAEPPTEEETPLPEAPTDDALSDEGWTLTNLEVRDDGLRNFSALGRVTNETGQAAEAASFSVSVLDGAGGDVIATMQAAVINVEDGETVIAEFLSVDAYQDGDWTYEFTVRP